MPFAKKHPFLTRLLLWVVALAVVLNLACLGVRVDSAVTRGDLALTTSAEEFSVYSLWKAVHHEPLYEWPNQDPYALTPYNFGFYETYAVLLGGIAGLDNAHLLLGGRLLTAASTLAGAFAQYLLCLWLLGGTRVSRASRFFLAGMALVVWAGTGYNSWNAISIRPDVPGEALTVFAVLAYGYSWRRERAPGIGTTRALLLLAAALFYAAWAFKQSLIWTFAGMTAHACWRLVAPEKMTGEKRTWTPLLWLTVPLVAAVAISLRLGGEVYFFSTVRVQTYFVYSLLPGVSLLAKTIVPNGLMWLFVPAVLLAVARRERSVPGSLGALSRRREFPLYLALVPTLAFGAISLCKLGAGTNTIIEGFILASILSTAWVAAALSPAATEGTSAPGRLTLTWAALAALLLLPVPALQLLRTASAGEKSSNMIGSVNIGSLSRYTASEYRRRQALAHLFETMPKPVFTRDQILGMPWHATDNRRPAFFIEPDVWHMFQKNHVILGDGLAGYVRERRFATLVLSPRDELYPVALEAGYHPHPLPDEAANAPDAMVFPLSAPLQELDR